MRFAELKPWGALCLALLLAACSATHPLDRGRSFSLEETDFSDLPGWSQDRLTEALPALKASCAKAAAVWQPFCDGLDEAVSEKKLRRHIQRHLTPYAVTADGSETGRITGYYEAELTGTREKTHAGQVPVYGVPRGYVYGDTYPDREDIETDGLDAPIIAWADDPVELFILHVQGSGRLITPEGEIKLGYAGNNNQPFKGLGSILAEADVPHKSRYAMPAIKAYLQAHPEKARRLMRENPRYIFFKETKGESPYGAAGVVLTPLRSIAVDNAFIPMHTPVWLAAQGPDGETLNRLVVAQDKGTAIKGGIRADFFFGHGEEAFQKSGRMNRQGRYFLLLPHED